MTQIDMDSVRFMLSLCIMTLFKTNGC